MDKDRTISCLSRAKTLSANLSGAVLLNNAQLISRQAYGTPLSAFTCDPYSKSLNLVTTSLSYILASEQGLIGAAARAAELWNRRRREAWHETDRKKQKKNKKTRDCRDTTVFRNATLWLVKLDRSCNYDENILYYKRKIWSPDDVIVLPGCTNIQ